MAIKQYVWGLNYIDEFVQIAVNHDLWNNPQMADPHPWGVNPWSEPLSVKKYYAMQDANYNVLGMADATGILVERYEYTFTSRHGCPAPGGGRIVRMRRLG